MPIETLKEEMVAMVQEEGMSFMEAMEEPPEEEPKAMSAGPIMEEKTTKEEAPGNKGPAAMEVASAPNKEATQKSRQEKAAVVKEKNESKQNKEPRKEKPVSKNAATSVVSKQGSTKQKKVQSKETIKLKLAKVMAKVDEKVKNPLKNLQLKNLIKMDAMVEDQLSLDVYNVAFYVPKDIYLEQLNLIDNRLIYANKSLATYIQNDKIEIKARKLNEINSRKQKLLIELEVLKNG